MKVAGNKTQRYASTVIISKHSGSGYEGPDRLSRTQMSGFKKAKCKDHWNTKKHAGTAQAAWVFVLSCPDARYSTQVPVPERRDKGTRYWDVLVSFVNPIDPNFNCNVLCRVFNWQLPYVQYSIVKATLLCRIGGGGGGREGASESKGQKRENKNCTGWFCETTLQPRASLLNAGKQQQGPDRMAANEIFGQGETMPLCLCLYL
ncbi:unnamed protein product [Fusarium venenatum]|uniref:Uncharacterized protein n=1 Tax=Fusarium venenatum TaxID=56646 RepID=A0A2L2TD41_9HYPO|nr:uncharacterized protein FVRRES_08971 [Fusarium venenatum]CEI68894.1 unnamed protein product [Fusarium venenatum]